MDFTPEREGVVKDDKTGNHYSDYCVEMRTKNVSSSNFLGKNKFVCPYRPCCDGLMRLLNK